MTLVVMLGAAAMAGGCGWLPMTDIHHSADRIPLDDTGPWTSSKPTAKEVMLARSDFSIEIVRVTDSRRPRSMMAQSKDQMIYQYDPDTLLPGVSTNVPSILGKYLSYRPKMPKHYKVEIDIKKLVTDIKTGSLWSGHWGRYHVAFEVDVIARRPDSTVALQQSFRYDETQARKDYNGRGPTQERDRARMFDLSESIFRKAAEDIGLGVRQQDARYWHPVAPQTIKTKLNLPPVDRASGTSDADTPPARLNGTVEQAPIIVPSAPASGWIDGGPAPADEGMPLQDLPVYVPEGDEGPVI